MPRIPRKTTAVLAEAEAYGRTLGELKAKAHFRTLNASNGEGLRSIFDEMIEKIEPIELSAIVLTAYVIKPTVQELNLDVAKAKYAIPASLFPFISMIFHIEPPKPEEATQSEFVNWALAFVVAYIIIKFGPQIITLMGSLANLIKSVATKGAV